jgi:HK97 family phage portal protein
MPPRPRALTSRPATGTRRRGLVRPPRATGPAGLSPPGSWAFLTGDPYPDGPYPATEQEALGLPPFGRGVALLCNAIAGTEWRAMRWDADLGVSVRRPDQPAILTNTTGDETTVWAYRWGLAEDLILYGNHFALYGEPDTAFGFWPRYLVPLPADEVWIITDPANPGWYAWTIAGEVIDRADMLHVTAGNRSGEVLGRGVLRQYAEWLGGSVAAEEHAGQYFAGGALPPAVLSSPVTLTQAQADELKSKWREMTSTREPVVLPAGYVLTPVVSNAEQAQLVESRQWNAAAVAMMLGIPSYKLGLAGPSMTYQNIETADIEFVRDSVDRYAAPIVAAFSKWLMPAGTTVAWDYAGRMRADQKTTSEVLKTYVDAGILDVDEARATIGRPPMDTTQEEGGTPAGVPELTPEEVTADAG